MATVMDASTLAARLARGAVLRVHGAAGAVAALRHTPPGGWGLLAAPAATGAALGPGWPRALVEGVAAAWPADAGGRNDAVPPPLALAVDYGAAVGLALAALEDWPAPAGWTLLLVLDPAVPAAAVAALAARGAARGVAVITAPP